MPRTKPIIALRELPDNANFGFVMGEEIPSGIGEVVCKKLRNVRGLVEIQTNERGTIRSVTGGEKVIKLSPLMPLGSFYIYQPPEEKVKKFQVLKLSKPEPPPSPKPASRPASKPASSPIVELGPLVPYQAPPKVDMSNNLLLGELDDDKQFFFLEDSPDPQLGKIICARVRRLNDETIIVTNGKKEFEASAKARVSPMSKAFALGSMYF